MRAIEELASATAKRLIGFVFDVDDTLTRSGRLEEAAYSALWRLRDAGLLLIAVTGRPLGFAEILARMWPIDVAVGENGAGYIRVTEAGLQRGFYAPDLIRLEHEQRLTGIQQRVARQAPFAKVTDDSWARRCDATWDVGERVRLTAAQIAQLRAIIESEGARCVVSSVHAHAMVGEYDKARGAVQAARETLGYDIATERERWLFVGDSGNDSAAFEYFPESAAVANVAPFLQQFHVPPRYVSRGDRGVGFAEIAALVLQRRLEATP